MERDPVRASARLTEFASTVDKRIEELDNTVNSVKVAYRQFQDGAITIAEFQMWVLTLASAANALQMAADEKSFASGAKLSGW